MIRLGDGRVVLRRGVTQLLLAGQEIEDVAGTSVALLDGIRTTDEVIEAFPSPQREMVAGLIDLLAERGLIGTHSVSESAAAAQDPLESSFYANFGQSVAQMRERLRDARVVVFGINVIGRSLSRSLVELGVGSVTLVDHPILNNEFVDDGWVGDLDSLSGSIGPIGVVNHSEAERQAAGTAVICAVSDLGEAEALSDVNRLALRERKPFLPAWVSDLVGYVGPLTYPFETACYRCFRLRADSNARHHEIAREVRRHATTEPLGRRMSGFVPPMARIVGEIGAMETLKALTGFVPSDAVGRLVEVNLVSFASTVHRVLKVPRCPDCSDVMERPGVVLTVGPQIPFGEGTP